MARTRNPRNVILDDLRILNRWFRRAIGRFDQGRRIYDTDLRRIRPRTYAELIENDPAKLREFADGAIEAAFALQAIAEKARQAADAAEKRQQEQS